MEAYCVKCKEKREIKDPEAVYAKNGVPATRGTCAVCGTNVYKMGRTPAHEHVEPPPKSERTVSRKRKKKKKERKGKLVIVESPAKARTVGRFLGRGYTVKASVGHVRDLLRSKLSVDVENDFEPRYRVPNGKRDVVKELTAAAEKAKEIYIATDPDREGEAIAWHLIAAADIEEERAHRVVFHEITDEAVEEAFSHPRDINMELVNAQQARRILDRLVGYNLTPLLWSKVRNRLSAGRVQSVALRMVVEREREIEAFEPNEYWSIDAELAKKKDDRAPFVASLAKIKGENFELNSREEVDEHLPTLEKSLYTVSKVKRGTRRRNPTAPFTTSTLQQEASRRLGFGAQRTMRVAQELYEGIETDDGVVGLITYMRTDSTNVAAQAQSEARDLIADRFGKEYLPDEPPVYKTRAKGAQEAHEAIRPTSAMRAPEDLKGRLSRDQNKLYTLIWQRFIASQMIHATYKTLRVEITAGLEQDAPENRPYLFRVSGSILIFMGFLAVYEESQDEDTEPDADEGRILPEMKVGELLNLRKLLPEQHFTQPPPRYTEASLVRTMEENGIGRPSTYAPTISTIQQRGYVYRESKRLFPTETGILVNDLLVEWFPDVVDYNFTARMEDELDQIAAGDREWVPVLREFYDPFAEKVARAERDMPEIKVEEEVGRDCPECNNPLIVKWGRYGKFIGCSNYPDCRYTEPWVEYVGVKCPDCEDGEIIKRKSRKGRTFYGCSNYPECEFTSWKRPVPQACPVCDGLMVIQNKKVARCTKCENEVPLETLELEPITP
jgi:DNA topoisomerase-1